MAWRNWYKPILRCYVDYATLLFEELQVPNMSQQSLAELHERAQNISQVVGDFKLEAFIGRLVQLSNSDASFESIASLAASKPPP